ncbi:MAG: glycosyltransferase family 39 protein [Planctomycetota bacterium]
MTRLFAAIAHRRWAQALIVTLLCAVVFGVNLGTGGLTRSEGHRVGPGWQMLEHDHDGPRFVPHLFDTMYVRKPPGTPIAIAASTWVLGHNEWGARLPSAMASLAMSLVVMVFAWRWFGTPYGLAAGMPQALLPWFWESGRAAEIEAMHSLGAMLACLAVVQLALTRTKGALAEIALMLGVGVAVLTKGPAAGVALVSACLGASLATRSAGGLTYRVRAGVFVGLGTPLMLLAMMWGYAHIARTTGEVVVSQSPGEFLWGDPLGSLALPFVAIVMAMPMSLSLLFPWGPDAREEAARDGDSSRAHTVVLALAWAWLIGAVGSAVIGLSNPRYVLPVATMTAPMVAYVVWGACGGFDAKRRAIARAMLLAGKTTRAPGLLWIPILLVGWGVYVFVVERGVRATSGREAGFEIAALLTDLSPDGGVIHADHAIEARPEVLLYAEREHDALRGGWSVWTQDADLPPTGDWVLLRVDDGSDERSRLAERGLALGDAAWQGDVHKYTFALFRVE